MYINQQTQQTYKNYSDIRRSLTSVSLPKIIDDEILANLGFFPVVKTEVAYDPMTQIAEVSGCIYQNNQWETSWAVRQMTAEERTDYLDRLKQSILEQTQNRLDSFAKTKNYDGILSACTYATSTNAVFQAEGQRAVQLRDDTWQALYNILGQVATQGRVVTGYEDIEADLPVLSWI